MRAKPFPHLQVLERHVLEQGRFAGARLSDDVEVRKAIFMFDAKDAIVVAKIYSANVDDTTALQIGAYYRSARTLRERWSFAEERTIPADSTLIEKLA
jgi:hypothetical protein